MAYAFNLSVLEAMVGGKWGSEFKVSLVGEVYFPSKKEAAVADNK